MKNSDIIALYLKELKIKDCFGIIGSANSHIFNSIRELGYTKIHCLHHEQAVVMAMGAYYRASGNISVAIVTAGAGASNAITGVISNWADSIPGIIFSGNESTYHINEHSNLRMWGTQGFDIVKMVKDVTKYSVQINEESNIQRELEKSYKISLSDRPGPVWIDIPFNIQSESSNIEPWDLNIHSLSSPNISKIIEALNNSKRPLIVGGNGIRLSNSKEIFQKFVSKISVPVTLTWSGIDLLPSNQINYYGRFGVYGQRAANFIVQNADLIIVLGSRLALPQTGYDYSSFGRNAKIIIVDIDEIQFPKEFVSLHIKENCFNILNELDKNSKLIKRNFSDWIEYCNNIKLKYPIIEDCHIETESNYINSYNFIDKLSDLLKPDQIIVTDMGTALLSGHQAIKLTQTQKMFTSLGLGEMGYGLPGAIGAAIACPEQEVLCLNCDGGIMMNLQELHTIIEMNLNIKIIIFNNDGYLMIKHTQKMLFKGAYTTVNKSTGVGLPNFKKLLPAFGFKYLSLSDELKIQEKVNELLISREPTVLEVFMNPEQDFSPKVKGILQPDNKILSLPIEDMAPLKSLEEIKSSMLIELNENSKITKR